MSLCRAPISAQQRLLSSGGRDFYTNFSITSLGSSRRRSVFPQEPFNRQSASDSRFLWSMSWFGRLHFQNIIRSPATGRRYQHTSVDIFCTRKATTTLIVTARQDPSSHLFLLTYWCFFNSLHFLHYQSSGCHLVAILWWKVCLVPALGTSGRNVPSPAQDSWGSPQPSSPTVLFPKRESNLRLGRR